jgi:N-acetylmuramoyl-L-alanine amidase
MRRISNIVVHCSATPLNTTIESIRRYWRNNLGWRNVGYHIIIKADGTWERLADDSQVTNGVAGHNSNSIHICTIGGRTRDDRTEAQKQALLVLLREYRNKYPNARILGHRDFPRVAKACPQYDVEEWLKSVGFQ